MLQPVNRILCLLTSYEFELLLLLLFSHILVSLVMNSIMFNLIGYFVNNTSVTCF